MNQTPVRTGSYGIQATLHGDEYRAATADIDFFIDQLRTERVTGRILELGTGTGRVALPLARAGYDVTGIDISADMLAVARRQRRHEPPEVAARLHYRQADMRTMALAGPFSAVLAPFSVFGCLLTPAERHACLARCHRALAPDGLLLIDALAPADSAAGLTQTRMFVHRFRLARVGHHVLKRSYETREACGTIDRMAYHYRVFHAGHGQLIGVLHVRFRLARLTAAVIREALDGAGFHVERLAGDYRGRPYGPTSPRLIVQARRA